MSKDKQKKIARAILSQVFASEHARLIKKSVKSERDARAKREKRATARAAQASGVVTAPIDDYDLPVCIYGSRCAEHGMTF